MTDELNLIAAWREVVAMTPEPLTAYSPKEAKGLRAANGMSQETAARILGVSTYSLGGWERGKHQPSPEVASRYARFLAVLAHRAARNAA